MGVKLRKKPLLDGKESLYLDINYNQKRHYEFLNLYLEPASKRDKQTNQQNKEVWELANQIRNNREIELTALKENYIPMFKKKANFIDYCKKIANEKKVVRTYLAYNQAISYLIKFAIENNFIVNKEPYISFDKLNKELAKQFQNYLLDNIKPSSTNLYFSIIKTCCKRATEDNIILQSPFDFVKKLKTENNKREYLTLKEIEILNQTNCGNPEYKKLFLFSCFVGLRISDLFELKYSDIDFENRRLYIRQGKTKEIISIRLKENVIKLIQNGSEIKPDDKVFKIPAINIKGKKEPQTSLIDKVLKRWIKRANINKNITIHNARHSFAVNLIDKGADIYTVSKLLGHKEIRTTQIYTEILDKRKDNAIDNLPDIEFDI